MSGTSRDVSGSTGRHDRRRRSVAVVVGVLAASTVVWQSSHAAFSSTTTNSGNILGAGTVTITNNNIASAMFSASNLAPGATASACIGVQYNGSLTPTAIKIYASGAQESNAGGGYGAWANNAVSEMDDNTSLQIEIDNTDKNADPGNSCVAAGSFVNVTAAAPGTNLRTLISTNTDFTSGLASNWGTITATKWRTFRFTYTFSSSAPNSAQGDGVTFDVVWEAQR